MNNYKCVVLFSGGQDSTTCLLLAINRWGKENVYPVSFYYEQRHKVELDQAAAICRYLNIREPMLLSAAALSDLGGASLTDKNVDVGSNDNVYAREHGLPSSVVPGRNMLFLTLAAAYGARIGSYHLLTGGCLADYEGYPDCRPEFYRAAQHALQLALDEPKVQIVTPLTRASKGETFAIAHALHELGVITELTHTCYNGDRSKRHDWGAGCGECNACITREKGWDEFFFMPINERVEVAKRIENGLYFG